MKKIAFFDSKPYDKKWFDHFARGKYEISYFEGKLSEKNVKLCEEHDAVCAFVNDSVNEAVVARLKAMGIGMVVMRSAGYNNVDLDAIEKHGVSVARVPAYSPYAVAEHAMALLLAVNRKTHKAYLRSRDFNFSLNNLIGVDLHGKTVGVIGTGKIGRVFIDICNGFGMRVLAYDPYPVAGLNAQYVQLDELLSSSDVISLHCPLTPETAHVIGKSALKKVKRGVIIINTSRGGLIDSESLLAAIEDGTVGGAGLDVYEEESDLFFEDNSQTVNVDDVLALLVSKPNVLITSHQGFFTEEALENIAKVTVENLDEYFEGKPLSNRVCKKC